MIFDFSVLSDQCYDCEYDPTECIEKKQCQLFMEEYFEEDNTQ